MKTMKAEELEDCFHIYFRKFDFRII